MNAAGNLYQMGQVVSVKRDNLSFKGEVIGLARNIHTTFTRPSTYVVELSNGEILRANESDLEPHVVSDHKIVFYHIAVLILVMISILLFTRI